MPGIAATTSMHLDIIRNLPEDQRKVANEIYFVFDTYPLWSYFFWLTWFSILPIFGLMFYAISWPNSLNLFLLAIFVTRSVQELFQVLAGMDRNRRIKKILRIITSKENGLSALRSLSAASDSFYEFAKQIPCIDVPTLRAKS